VTVPVAYFRPDGVVTNLLVDQESLPSVANRYIVDSTYFDQVTRRFEGTTGYFYLTPPAGAVVAPLQSGNALLSSLELEFERVPATTDASTVTIDMGVRKTKPIEVGGTTKEHRPRLFVGYRIWQVGTSVVRDGVNSPGPCGLEPGRLTSIPVTIKLPQRQGQYLLQFAPLLDGVGWGSGSLRLVANVLDAQEGSYRAELTVPQ
jgi:hypothetical protein